MALKINYRNTNWSFKDDSLTLTYSNFLSKKQQQEIFDMVAFKDRLFLVLTDKRAEFIDKIRTYESITT